MMIGRKLFLGISSIAVVIVGIGWHCFPNANIESHVYFFSFENDMEGWNARAIDLELANSTINWSITRTQENAKDGNTALKFYLENWNDMGKIWIERTFFVEPNTSYQVDVKYAFATADWGVANFFKIITGVVRESPQTRDELVYQGDTANGAGSDVGYIWLDKSYNFTVRSSPTGELYTIIGVWGCWETHRTYYVDKIDITLVIDASLLGDINSDGKVNILDISLVAKAYNTRPQDSRWNPKADINGDGTIDILDISAIAKEYRNAV